MDELEDLELVEELEELDLLVPTPPRLFRDRLNPFDVYSDRQFLVRFRLSKDGECGLFHQYFYYIIIYACISYSILGCHRLIERVRGNLTPMRHRQMAIQPEVMVMCTLYFMGNCAFQRDIGDLFGIVQSVVSRVLAKTIPAIAALRNEWISLPAGEDARKQMLLFFNKAGIPGMCCLEIY
jgi:hypothetical protein